MSNLEQVNKESIFEHLLKLRTCICVDRYIGHSNGNISVLKLDQNPWHMVQMKYTIPLSASYGELHYLLTFFSLFFVNLNTLLDFEKNMQWWLYFMLIFNMISSNCKTHQQCSKQIILFPWLYFCFVVDFILESCLWQVNSICRHDLYSTFLSF